MTVGPVAAETYDGLHRVIADVAGEPIWFESSDTTLDDAPEALGSAMLIAAVAAGRQLHITGPASRVWLSNVVGALEIWWRWWGYPVIPPEASVLRATRPRAAGAALCFTGGVDSFHTLLRGPEQDVLAFVQGFDITLADSVRMAAWERSFREIAATAGKRAVVLRSNLRDHPLFGACDWDRSHGGALAAVGHLLAGHAGTFLISSGLQAKYDFKWGSHPQLDPHWSSDRVTVVHYGATHSRLDKIRDIADEELVHRHLRVCHENRAPVGNCSRCDKCLCTMVMISVCGLTDRFRVFDWSGSLAGHIDCVPRTRFIRTYGEVLEAGPDRRVAAAIRSLRQRTPSATG